MTLPQQKQPPADFPLTDRFTGAMRLAHEWHRGQYRKVAPGETPTVPYLSHLLGVASVALEFGATETEAIAALLHDALEDGPEYTRRSADALHGEIRDTFGPEVARLVKDATDAEPQAGEEKAPWGERKANYLRELEAQQSASSLLVSASDKLHNARAILTDVLTAGDSSEARTAFFGRFKQGQSGTLQYYRLLVDAYRAAPGGRDHPRLLALFDELDRTVTALEQACGVTAETTRNYPNIQSNTA
ncbi:bifunctional (p)ppGpp synthetase/guanosine-3',5'-bis(diphosphate) 3'-pyrophosphohydrolase [Deinococcus sp. SDU3-2]|uniref:Bifunctional (P)ppGpp synthetase/guanosine-3',5'-bis(Diphosphate) 3'-pyrophosphohydrolase n=1 Tax=Deinococcus terrestris TaxID=2651870 RepID=A0A7X1NXJ4_9DEIO|nr:HD domain-containing protein [Deinococcus terrestris]MPY67184.1 bifunctional (p)ppGpp synthetase/guanosine-3',5'-bis(diphosphate) 3'-pyrophosphohydrolase [Deinococcus terrestris]